MITKRELYLGVKEVNRGQERWSECHSSLITCNCRKIIRWRPKPKPRVNKQVIKRDDWKSNQEATVLNRARKSTQKIHEGTSGWPHSMHKQLRQTSRLNLWTRNWSFNDHDMSGMALQYETKARIQENELGENYIEWSTYI